MKELYVIRHGIAEQKAPNGSGDEKRELTGEGKKKVKLIAKSLKGMDVEFDAIISSPLTRSMQTAKIIMDICPGCGEVAVTDLLKPDGQYDDLIKYLNTIEGAERVSIVGHEPFLSGFISYCLSKSRNPFIRMKKGAVALISIDEHIIPGKAELQWLMGPKQIIGKSD